MSVILKTLYLQLSRWPNLAMRQWPFTLYFGNPHIKINAMIIENTCDGKIEGTAAAQPIGAIKQSPTLLEWEKQNLLLQLTYY